MRPQDLIEKKRDGHELSRQEIALLIRGYTRDEIPDYQMSAWLMAVFLNGMTEAETQALVEEMLYSGEVLTHPDIAKPKVDKHSTGGVGDKTSLVVGPVAAACGVVVQAEKATLFVRVISLLGAAFPDGTPAPHVRFELP